MTGRLTGLRSALFNSARAELVTVTVPSQLPTQVMAIRYDKSIDPGFDPTDGGSAFRQVRFEIAFNDLPSAPVRPGTINDGTTIWTVAEVETKPEVASWMIVVENLNA